MEHHTIGHSSAASAAASTATSAAPLGATSAAVPAESPDATSGIAPDATSGAATAVGKQRRQLSAQTANAAQRATGIGMMLTSSVSNQVGAALGAQAFPIIGPVGVVAIRQFVTAITLAPIAHPTLRGLRKDQWQPIIGLVVVYSVMNLSLYTAVSRIGLAMAVTLEFLGPLTVAIASSRRIADIVCAILAAVGVIVLTDPGPTTDVIGIACALLAATAWGVYILLNRSLGQRLPGLQGTATASLLTAMVWTPIAIARFAVHTPTVMSIVLAVACGLMASAIPYAADLLALRRVPAQMFGTFTSLNPVWAALAGWLLLHQTLRPNEWAGIALIILSNALVSARELKASKALSKGTDSK